MTTEAPAETTTSPSVTTPKPEPPSPQSPDQQTYPPSPKSSTLRAASCPFNEGGKYKLETIV